MLSFVQMLIAKAKAIRGLEIKIAIHAHDSSISTSHFSDPVLPLVVLPLGGTPTSCCAVP